jgi:hypothetical protein
MTIHYHRATIFPNTPNNKDAGFRAGRLMIIRQAMAGRSSGRVHTAEDTIHAEKLRELADVIDEILPALELSADQRDHLKVGAAEIGQLVGLVQEKVTIYTR